MPKLTNISGIKAVKTLVKFAPFLLRSQIKRADISIADFIRALK